ncbi:MAG TPA: BON domain-containing protein [Pyrinomonadaceae bacterium]|nr:BON domain-containing protein [Pyrinomonadaceae bacterium]
MYLTRAIPIVLLFPLALSIAVAQDQQKTQSSNMATATTVSPQVAAIVREVRHELVTMPYYGVFDWIEYEVQPDGTVILRGEVISPPDKKGRAEAAVKRVEGVTKVVNEIEVLPVSPSDDRLRLALHRAIYGFDSPLHRYGVGILNQIHIIVKNGRATLKGEVDSEADKQIAYTRARGVSGLFEVTNELRVATERPR